METSQRIADDWRTEKDVGGVDSGQDDSPEDRTAVADLSAAGEGKPNNAIADQLGTSRRRDHAQADPARRFKSVPELIAAIDEFILVNNKKSQKHLFGPKTSKTSWKKIGHCKAIIETLH